MSQARVAFSIMGDLAALSALSRRGGMVAQTPPSDSLGRFVLRLVAANLGFELQVPERRVERAAAGQRGARSVEMQDVRAARCLGPQPVEVEARFRSSIHRSISCTLGPKDLRPG